MAKAKGFIRSIFGDVEDTNMRDMADLTQVPDVPQRALPRYDPPRGMPSNLGPILTTQNMRRLSDIAERGKEQGGLEWYNLEPLRMAFVEELGPEAGGKAFDHYIDIVAATSPRSKVDMNIRRASHLYQRSQNGQPIGGLANSDMPKGYGHIAHNTHDSSLRDIQETGSFDAIHRPKTSSFAENLKGNQQPMTIDTHNWSAVRNDPSNKKSPSDTQYKYIEEYQAEIADKLGMTPAQFQASVWMAGDTGVADARPFIEVFDDVLTRTAERNGTTRVKALRDFIKGDAALYSMPMFPKGSLLTEDEQGHTFHHNASDSPIVRRKGLLDQ